MTLGLGVTAFMFAFTYLPQLAVLVFTSGPIAALTTVLLVLSESSTLTMVLSKTLLIEDALIDTFDGTLVERGEPELVARERQVKSGRAGDAIARLGKLVSKPFEKFTPTALIRYFMYLPLNFIPVVGTAIFVLLQGKKFGPSAHARYFQLKNMSKDQREKHVEERQGAYTRYVMFLLWSNGCWRANRCYLALALREYSLRWYLSQAYSLRLPIHVVPRYGQLTWRRLLVAHRN